MQIPKAILSRATHNAPLVKRRLAQKGSRQMNEETMRIRALAVQRMNRARHWLQGMEEIQGIDEDYVHAWNMVRAAMQGLIEEIDNGSTVQDIRERSTR